MTLNKKIINFIIVSIFGIQINASMANNVYLDSNDKQEAKKSYKYINGKIYYGDQPNKIEQKSTNNEKVASISTEIRTPKEVNNELQKQAATTYKRPNEVFFVKGGQPCFEEAARYHNVDPWLLMSIAYVESRFNAKAINKNKNGSYDTGMMQINSIWIPHLKKKGINKELLNDACASTYIGAWILSDNIRRYGYNWRAIGAYNSGNPKLGLAYAKKVYAAHDKITKMAAQQNK